MQIEVSLSPGKGKLILTGKLGDVMKESAQTALSYVRSKTEEFGIDPDFHESLIFIFMFLKVPFRKTDLLQVLRSQQLLFLH